MLKQLRLVLRCFFDFEVQKNVSANIYSQSATKNGDLENSAQKLDDKNGKYISITQFISLIFNFDKKVRNISAWGGFSISQFSTF